MATAWPSMGKDRDHALPDDDGLAFAFFQILHFAHRMKFAHALLDRRGYRQDE